MSYYGPEGSGQASDPWQQGDPSYPQVDLGYPSGYQQAAPPQPQGGSKALLAVLVTVLVLILCGGGVGALYLLGRHGGGSGTAGSTTPGTGRSSFDPTSVTEGQCLVITPPTEAPHLQPGGCTPGNYEVLKRINGTSDDNRCQGVPSARFAYHYATTPETDSFVLCLQRL
jgi:hypothetical protein